MEPVTKAWTYLGKITKGAGVVRHQWRDEEGTPLSFTKLMAKGAQPGSIWDVTVSYEGEGLASMHSRPAPTYKGMISDPDELLQLQISSRAEEAEARRSKEAKADMDRNTLATMLAPLKEEYHRRNRVGRMVLIAVVLEEMQR